MKMPVQDKEETSFQMAPMIDMVFLLLVFFMCASHLAQQQNIELEIPTAQKAVVPKERPDRWVVNILKDGSIYEGQNLLPDKNVDLIKKHVEARLAENPELKVYLRADKEAPHKEVKRVMNAMAEAGISDFIFGVYIPSETARTQLEGEQK